ncbi:hypothetical protein VOLCADRAFT_35014, partial [Volvox carteri f. nagariensis]
DKYRGIAVGDPLCKLHANLVGRRLTKVCEDNGLRAARQAGCRHGFGTEHHLLTLRDLI